MSALAVIFLVIRKMTYRLIPLLLASYVVSYIDRSNIAYAALQKLKAGDRTRFENELVDATISGNIHFYGPTSALVINGKILSDQGEIVYSGNEFKLTEAQLEIFTPLKAEQYLEPNQTLV